MEGWTREGVERRREKEEGWRRERRREVEEGRTRRKEDGRKRREEVDRRIRGKRRIGIYKVLSKFYH